MVLSVMHSLSEPKLQDNDNETSTLKTEHIRNKHFRLDELSEDDICLTLLAVCAALFSQLQSCDVKR